MAHQYSVEIHSFLTEKLKEAESLLEKAEISGSVTERQYAAGRKHALLNMRTMMSERFDLSNRKYFD